MAVGHRVEIVFIWNKKTITINIMYKLGKEVESCFSLMVLYFKRNGYAFRGGNTVRIVLSPFYRLVFSKPKIISWDQTFHYTNCCRKISEHPHCLSPLALVKCRNIRSVYTPVAVVKSRNIHSVYTPTALVNYRNIRSVYTLIAFVKSRNILSVYHQLLS